MQCQSQSKVERKAVEHVGMPHCKLTSPLSLVEQLSFWLCKGRGPLNPFLAPVLKNERVTAADHFQDVRHIELDIAESDISYRPGDVLCMYPGQNPDALDELMRLLNVERDVWLRVELAAPDAPAPSPCAEVKPLICLVFPPRNPGLSIL